MIEVNLERPEDEFLGIHITKIYDAKYCITPDLRQLLRPNTMRIGGNHDILMRKRHETKVYTHSTYDVPEKYRQRPFTNVTQPTHLGKDYGDRHGHGHDRGHRRQRESGG